MDCTGTTRYSRSRSGVASNSRQLARPSEHVGITVETVYYCFINTGKTDDRDAWYSQRY